MNLELGVYATAIARAIKMPVVDARKRLERIFSDPILLGVLREVAEDIGSSSLVTNVEYKVDTSGARTFDANGRPEVEVSVTAMARAGDKSVEPPVLEGRIES